MTATPSRPFLLLTAIALFSGPVQPIRAEEPAEQAVAHVQTLGGSVVRDEKRPGKPVVRVSLAFKAKVTDEDLKALAPLTELTELDLQSTGITAAGLKHLAPLKNLAKLDLGATTMSGSGLKDLAALPKLTTLRLYSCSHTEASLKGLAQVKSLTSMVVSDALFDLKDSVLKEWAALKNLRSLKLHGPNITDEGLKSIAELSELTDLLVWFPQKTTPDGWKPLGRLTKLRSLSLAGGNVPKPEGGNVTDAVIAHLAPLTELEQLELVGTGVTDAALATVGKFAKLTVLRIESSATVTDAGLKSLTKLKGLTSLKLNYASVSDESLKVLTGFPKLTVLDVGGTKITREGAQTLRDKLPKCEVTWFPRRK
jgi:internalin A